MKLSLTLEENRALLLLMGANACYDEDSLRKAYRCKVKKSHPDLATNLGKDPSLMKMQFQELNDAFHLLLEKIKNDNNEYTKRVYRKARSGSYKPTSNSTRRQHTKTQGSWQHSKTTKNYKAGKASQSKKRSAESKYNTARSMTGKYYTGPLPEKMLRFAEYLYYTGEISWDELVHALVWQYRNRPKLGELAESRGIIKQKDILFIIKNRQFSEMFGEAAVRLGIFDKKSLDKLVRQQKMFGLPIGRFFLEKNIFSEDQLFRKLTSNRRHNLYHRN
ncbi:MAG: hypothetical protein B6241_14495 [Spirochaetaceae bacterium 4572_59]|nr:MAG: hypothetical protein B6241_14495 [Spirochaetaceae bacterium 4572_59]